MYIFLSDLHLTEDKPEKVALFLKKLREWLHSPVFLCILGDLFHYWYSPSQGRQSMEQEVLFHLKKFARQNRLCFLPGNRDFLLSTYLQKTWQIPCAREALLLLGKSKVFLSHGDIFLEESKKEKLFRLFLQTTAPFLAPSLPPFFTKRVAKILRKTSQRGKRYSPSPRWNWKYLLYRMQDAHFAVLGHLHSPRIWKLQTPQGEKTIFSLPEWLKHPAYLIWNKEEWKWVF